VANGFEGRDSLPYTPEGGLLRKGVLPVTAGFFSIRQPSINPTLKRAGSDILARNSCCDAILDKQYSLRAIRFLVNFESLDLWWSLGHIATSEIKPDSIPVGYPPIGRSTFNVDPQTIPP